MSTTERSNFLRHVRQPTLTSVLATSLLVAGGCSAGTKDNLLDTSGDDGISQDTKDGNDSKSNQTTDGTSTASASESDDSSDKTDEDPSSDPTTSEEDIGDQTFVFDLDIPTGDPDVGEQECPEIVAVIRDFNTQHPDFQKFQGDVPTKGLVETMLGSDETPVYAGTGPNSQLSGKDAFAQWYHDTQGVNQRFEFTFKLERDLKLGLCVYDNQFFFPIDGKGFGDEGLTDVNGKLHNFLFTTEIHTKFTYHPGQVFRFIGDDDLWMFIDGKLAIDLGGLHPAATQEVKLDTLGLDPNVEHRMDIFHAERHTNASTFRIDTDIKLISDPL